eukprot:GHUV01043896.1.p1 GENE.GHUV01043896.1~~GHUV01043896.1.p1  ORF type:complete len:130 (-),score=21.27 GHUV01043896.1:352-741(-)
MDGRQQIRQAKCVVRGSTFITQGMQPRHLVRCVVCSVLTVLPLLLPLLPQAICWAWELSTVVFGLPPDRVWVSVYEDDEESLLIWRDVVGVDPRRIRKMGAEDNFWASGPTGGVQGLGPKVLSGVGCCW